MTTKCSISELVHEHIASDDDWFTRLVVYPFALPISWFLLNFTSVSANAVTLTGLAIGVIGVVAAELTHNPGFMLLGFSLYFVCDFVDGQVASAKGGSQLGAFLDQSTDHLMLIVYSIGLGAHHLRTGDTTALFLLLCYIGAHHYVDLLLFAKRKATGTHSAEKRFFMPPPRKRVRGSVFSAWRLLPSRLSSPIAFAATWFVNGSFETAYCVALAWVATEYLSSALKFAMRIAGGKKGDSGAKKNTKSAPVEPAGVS